MLRFQQTPADLPTAGTGQLPPTGHEDASPTAVIKTPGLQTEGKVPHDADDSGVRCYEDPSESSDDLFRASP